MFTERMIKTLITAGIKSDCHKRRFGAVAVKNNLVIGSDANCKLPFHEFMCDGDCIRMGINSGMDSMIGACGHAEERVIWGNIENIKGSEIYVLQIDNDEKPISIQEKSFYCLRCATTMFYAGVIGVWVLVGKGFEFLTTEEAIRSSYEFALGEKLA